MAQAPLPDCDVAYLTDVEGQWERLRSFAAHNPLVRLDNDNRLHVRTGAVFVFGGDAIDRGPAGRKIVRTFLEAKARQPAQVVLLAGNRDLNKMRLVRELAGHLPARAPEEVRALAGGALLKWIFQHTMGAADAFAHRRTELLSEGCAADDDTGAQSFLEDLAPGGDLLRYLMALQLGFRCGSTVYVHGGVASEALTHIPGQAPLALQDFHVDAWLQRLNAFYDAQVTAFAARALHHDGTPAWFDMILYQAPRKGTRLNPGSVVYGRMADAHNNPRLPEPHAMAALLRSGIHRVVVGHTPVGDVPSIVRTPAGEAPFEVVNADNSRARVETGTQAHFTDACTRFSGTCILDDGVAIGVEVSLPLDGTVQAVGQVTEAGEIVKAVIGSHALLFRYAEAFMMSQRLVSLEALGPLSFAGHSAVAAPSARTGLP